MFKDVSISIDSKSISFDYKITKGKIVVTLKKEKESKELRIFYDENVYDNFKPLDDFELVAESVVVLVSNLENYASDKINIEFEINPKFLVKMVYDYINEKIDKDTLLEGLNIFKKSIVGKNYKTKIDSLIGKLEEKSIDELLLNSFDKSLNSFDEKERMNNILLADELFQEIFENMSCLDMMLLITANIAVNRPFKLTQEQFDELVEEAKKYEYSLENVWRLAMNYDQMDFDYSKIEDFFVDTRDAYYLTEYMSGVFQANKKRIVDKLIKTNDKEFIKKILERDYAFYSEEQNYKKKLEEFVK